MEIGISLSLSRPMGQGSGVPSPYPPPDGYRWEYVTESTATDPNVAENAERVVELIRIAA